MTFASLKRNRLGAALVCMAVAVIPVRADLLHSAFSAAPQWRVGAELDPAFVPGSNSFLRGDNKLGQVIDLSLSGTVRADFSFNRATAAGAAYGGLYQGIGVGINTFFADRLLGTPVSAFVYQGAPIVRFGTRLYLGYEWQFGVAAGWEHFDEESAVHNSAVGTDVTAHMGIGVKLHYHISSRWQLDFGVGLRHYSNGNTAWPNAGVNTVGATVGVAYALNPQPESASVDAPDMPEQSRWFFDLTAFGAWRCRIVTVDSSPHLCPGRFGVAGMQFSPMRRLSRWIAVGAAIDFQWDESAGLAPYLVEGYIGDKIKFVRPPFGKQISLGLSAHAELTTPLFAVNAGVGYDVINPKGDKCFYQSLTLKTFVTDRLYLNTGYRLGNFKDPQNLMLGVGYRF